ncbi:MAG: [FeFe] hydrogenase H-cluster radical SAM maturase HydE [Bacteroidetes bacterium]|nr:[FeFe] hydrogenase H-cluster radical SAM maturase HydE [Bacteroidota bacterium]MCL2302042.1 [FeFe] hydrogenase H-cluster radical SAM maturase HydE [Lentimicrobiaceae bacterium]
MEFLIDKLSQKSILRKEEWIFLLSNRNSKIVEYACEKARQTSIQHFGNKVFVRGLIEFTNHCKNNCFYCGIRAGNKNAVRYRLTKEEILTCCRVGNELGFKTFVLQGGEDPYFTDEKLLEIITAIKEQYPDNALTLSFGERSYDSYLAFKNAGVDRYLLRHETANPEHYRQLHPKNLSDLPRKQCLFDLKRIGFQTGTGFMIGSPYQTIENLAEDMLFIADFKPQMLGIGPFIPHQDTPFADFPAGSVELTLFLLTLSRLLLPNVLLPATTALGTLDQQGREKAILSGANVVMPNLSPLHVREQYMLYNNKIATGLEAAEGVKKLEESMAKIGYELVHERGDFI